MSEPVTMPPPGVGSYTPSTEIMDAIDALPGRDGPSEQLPVQAPEPAPEPPAPVSAAPEPPPKAPETPKAADDDEFGLSKFTPKKAEPKPVEKPKVEPAKGGPKELRDAYEKLKTERETEAKRIAELEAKIAEAAKRPVPQEVEDNWKKQLEEVQKSRDEIAEQMRLVAYEKSPEFKREFAQPLEDAWKRATKTLVGQEVDVNGEPKTITAEDVQSIFLIDNDLQATRQARRLLGDGADAVLSARTRIRDLQSKRDEALETWRAKGTEFETKRIQESKELGNRAVSTFKGTVEAVLARHTDLKPRPDNTDEASAFEEGLKLNEQAFLNPPKTAEEAVADARRKGIIAARSAAFGPVMVRLNAANAEIEALKAKLATLSRSDPDTGGRGETVRPKTGKSRPSWDEAIDAIPGKE